MADQASKLPVLDGADGTDGTTAPSISTQIAGKDGSGNLQAILTDTSGKIQVDLNDGLGTAITSSTVGSKQVLDTNIPDKNNTGTISTLNGTVVVNTSGCASVIITITGTWSANLQFQGFDGTNWILTTGLTLPSGGITEALVANGSILVNCGGYAQVRVLAGAYTSGTANIFMNAGIGASLVEVYNDSQNPLITKAQLQDNSANGITSSTINSKQRLDVDLSSEAPDGASAPFSTVQVGGQDPTGKLQAFITLPSGEQFTRDVINVSSQFRAQSVTTSAAQALGAATILVNRKVITITPTNGTIYWGTSSGVTTTTGTPLFAFQTLTLSCTDNVPVWVIAAATVDTRIFEGS